MLPFTVHPVGDSALLAAFEQRIAPEIGAAVAALNARVQAAGLPGAGETVPAFASLMVTYNPLLTDYETLAAALQRLAAAPDDGGAAGEGRLVTIPVCYGGAFGPDLPFVAEHAGLEHIRFPDLRHTFATLALQNGVDVKTVSSMLGHYDAGFTLRTYTHVTRQMQRSAAEKMGNFMAQVR